MTFNQTADTVGGIVGLTEEREDQIDDLIATALTVVPQPFRVHDVIALFHNDLLSKEEAFYAGTILAGALSEGFKAHQPNDVQA